MLKKLGTDFLVMILELGIIEFELTIKTLRYWWTDGPTLIVEKHRLL